MKKLFFSLLILLFWVSTAFATTYTISGMVGGASGSLSGVTITITNSAGSDACYPTVVTTAADGTYTTSPCTLANGTYKVTPSMTGYIFSGFFANITVSGGNVTGVEFAAFPSSTAGLTPAIQVLPGTTVEVGQEVYFSATGSTLPSDASLGCPTGNNCGAKIENRWNYGDGYACENNSGLTGVGDLYYYVNCKGVATTHYFMAPGTYTVTLNSFIWGSWIPGGSLGGGGLAAVLIVTSAYNVGYTAGDVLTLAGGGKVTVDTVDGSGKILTYHISLAGSNYGISKSITTTGGTCPGSGNNRARFDIVAITPGPLASGTASTTITVTIPGNVAPLAGFEIQHANFNNRTKQYVYIEVPSSPTNYQTSSYDLVLSLIDTTASSTVVLKTWNSPLNENKYLLDHTGLIVGHNYVLQAQILNDSTQIQVAGGLYRELFTHAAPTVTMDENNSFSISGRGLVFPIETYETDSGKVVSYLSAFDINALDTEGYYPTHTPASWTTYLGLANAYLSVPDNNSLMAIGPGRGDYYINWDPSNANRWEYNHNVDEMATYVNTNKSNPAMFVWKWQDEPNMGGYGDKVYPPVLGAWAYAVHNNDSNHPTFNAYTSEWSIYYGANFVSNYDYQGSSFFLGGKKWMQDVLSFDVYPVKYALNTPQNLLYMGSFAIMLDAYDRAQRNNGSSVAKITMVPFIPFINPGADNGFGGYVIHSGAQVYNESWMSVIHGAKSIGWFQYFTPIPTDCAAAMIKFSQMMNGGGGYTALKNIILGPTPTRTVTNNTFATATSSDTRTITNSGSMSFTIQTGLNIVANMCVQISKNSTNYMMGNVTSYNSGTGALVVSLWGSLGSGSSSSWTMQVKNRVDTMIREPGDGNVYIIASRITEQTPVLGSITSPYPTMSSGGINYHVNDILSVAGGTNGQILVQQVDSNGTILLANQVGWVLNQGGYGYSVSNNNATSNFSGAMTGSGAIVNILTIINSNYLGTEPTTITPTFTVSGVLPASTTATVIGESRTVTVTSGVLQDTFNQNDAHIYQIPLGGSQPVYHNINVTDSGLGVGTVTSSDSIINCGTTCTDNILEGNTTTLYATPDVNSTFTGWGGAYGCTGTGNCVVSSIMADAAVTATFTAKTPPNWYMNVSYIGQGTGSTSPAVGAVSKPQGSAVGPITATPDTNSTFNGFGGTCGCTGTSTCSFTMPSNDCTVTADFEINSIYWLTVITGAGVNQIISSDGICYSLNLSCQYSHSLNDVITIQGTCNNGWNTPVITGDCASDGTVTMNGNKSCTVTCSLIPPTFSGGFFSGGIH